MEIKLIEKKLQLWQKRWLNTRYHNTCTKVRQVLNLSTANDEDIKSDLCYNAIHLARYQKMQNNIMDDIRMKYDDTQTKEAEKLLIHLRRSDKTIEQKTTIVHDTVT